MQYFSHKLNQLHKIEILLFLYTISFLLGNASINVVSAIMLVFHLIYFKNIERLNGHIISIIIFFSFILLSSYLFDDYDKYEIIKILKFLIIFFIVYSSKFITLEVLDRYLNFLKYLILFIALDVIFQKYFGYDFFGLTVPEVHKPRLTGPFFSRDPVPGRFIAYLSPLVILNLFEKKKFIQLHLLVCVLLFSIMLSGERMAFILFFFTALFTIILMSIGNKKLVFFYILSFCFFLLFTILFSESYAIQRIISIFSMMNVENLLNSHYFSHYLTSFKIFVKNFYFGSGFDNFKLICSLEIYSNEFFYSEQRCSSHQHNFYLQVLESFGIFIFTFFISTLAYPLVKLLQKYKDIKLETYKYISLYFLLIIPFKTSGDLFATWYGGLFWFLLAIAFKGIKITNHANHLKKSGND